ncbi:hypothetical protein QFZ94_006717 [Paraburkholderia sp. JPY465]|uniref:hypothetical protein n=1 Tax=Paraburkholderia sp. JPY465 TaxID=3042285 RepID=UPI003D1D44A5
MVALLSKFRTGDRVRIDATGELYAYIDGWRGIVCAVGPRPANAVHSQVLEGIAPSNARREFFSCRMIRWRSTCDYTTHTGA